MEKLKSITLEDNEKLLRQISKPVIFPDNDLENDLKILEKYIVECDLVLAIAAVQLGIPKRIIYLKKTDLELINKENDGKEKDSSYNEQRILINPVFISKEGLTDYWETCDSCLDNMGHVKRPYRIKIKYQDIKGHFHTETFEGFESTVLSHEMDHLDGILHIDISDEIIVMPPEERKEFRKNHGYNIVSKDGNFEELLKNNN